MKTATALFALSLLPLSLLAQTKPAARKPATATHSATNRVAKAPVKKPATVPQYTAPQPTNTVNTAAPAAQPQPTTAYVAPAAQPAVISHQAPAPQRVPAKASQSHFRIGFRVGGNSSTIGGVDLSAVGEGVKLARVTGFHGGVIFNIGGPSFSVQPEILFTQYGVRLASGSDYLQLKYNTVEVPVLLKASFGQPNLRFFINAGPVAAYTLSGVVSVQQGGQSDSQKMDMTNDGRLSFGASGGAGVSLQAGPGAFQVEARYSYLFSSNDDGAKLTPQNAMLSIGYLIPLGGR
ncbi:outer membrane beta-barrel protein [Spirosoma sp. HMF4905]|uniref:Outer membrane beta-barrel protein n=1 Tax=Spirosoma arboris TaxID=2682092 RepID=A0A7K1S4L0_9BACT|nr:porin family protein [Spirosoma arboris]MVM28546.1 outer membrane beta-barrel protein [Spirosoma arboris]